MLSGQSLLTRKPDQTFSLIDDEIVMLSIDNSEYYNFDSVGTFIWNELAEPRTFELLVSKLVAEYEVNREICSNDTKLFLEDLINKGIVQLIDE